MRALMMSNADKKYSWRRIRSGSRLKSEIGRIAAEKSIDVIKEIVKLRYGFITCGEGGGTGTGAAPIIAPVARKRLSDCCCGYKTIHI